MTEKKFKDDVCVVGGCGHVGLPLALVLADSGLDVTIYDIDAEAVGRVSKGEMPFMEEGAASVLERVIGTRLQASTDPSIVSRASSVIVIIGTPVDEHLNPMFTSMKRFMGGLIPHLRDGQCLILRSTVYPGTTAKIDRMIRETGLDVSVSFCPERIAQGRSMTELRTLPQIVSACDERGLRLASALFERISPSTIELEPLEAELTKIFANVWRYIQFATANQFFMISTEYGCDFHRIHDALTRDYPRMKGIPNSGFAAGPCLFKDTMQLATATHNSFSLGHAAMLINEGLPNFVVDRLKNRMDLSKSTVGVLGMAFKAESDDPRESLSYKLRKILEYEAGEVLCTDPYIRDPSFLPLDEVIRRSDVLILATPHDEYRGITFPDHTPVVDIWNLYGKGSQLT